MPLVYLEVSQVIIPNLLGFLSFFEEQKIGFHSRTRSGEYPIRKTHDRMDIAFVEELFLRFGKGRFVGSKKHSFVKHDSALSSFFELIDYMLDKQYLGVAGFVGKTRSLDQLDILLAPKRWIGENIVILSRRTGRESIVGNLTRDSVLVRNMGHIDAMDNEIGKRDGKYRVGIVLSPKSRLREIFDIAGSEFPFAIEILVRLSQKSSRTAAWIVKSLTSHWINRGNHRFDNRSWRKKLPTVRILVPHLQ